MANLVALWGAGVATGLAALRLFEFWRDRRPRLRTTYIWRGHPDIGNDVLIINDGRSPAAIYQLELVWAKARSFRDPVQLASVVDFEDEFVNITVPPMSFTKLDFSEDRHFPIRAPKRFEGARLYMKAWLVGRSAPLWLAVT